MLYIKVALPTIPVKDIFVLNTNDEVIKYLKDEGIYINNIDFTQELAGVINKDDVIQYLVENNDYAIEDYSIEDYVIYDNKKFDGMKCLNILHNTEHDIVKYKFYKKFIQSIGSPSVRGKIWSHIADLLSNPNKNLKNTINKSLDTGLLPLKIRFYINNNIVTEEYIHKHRNKFIIIQLIHNRNWFKTI